MIKITYCITVANEKDEFIKLISFLKDHKRFEDNILVLVDSPKCDCKLEDYILSISTETMIFFSTFKNNFSEWKNTFFNAEVFGGELNDYLFFIDADELPNPELIEGLPYILDVNPEVDVFGVPRINFVEGITDDYITNMGWRKDDKNRINYPDYQYRICKNQEGIRWGGKLHETIQGYKIRTELPQNDCYDLLHVKSFDKQVQQNEFYNTI